MLKSKEGIYIVSKLIPRHNRKLLKGLTFEAFFKCMFLIVLCIWRICRSYFLFLCVSSWLYLPSHSGRGYLQEVNKVT